MTMHEEWTDKLSDYLDGELSADQQRAVESHLRECVHCNAVLNDLKRVVARAQTTAHVTRPPHADLWAGIAARIDAERAPAASPAARSGHSGSAVAEFPSHRPRRIALTLPQLAAAAIVIAAVSSGLGWQLRPALTGGTDDQGVAANRSMSPAATDDRADVGHPFRGAAAGAGTPGFSGAEPSDAHPRIETIGLADAQYDAAVVDLERALQAGRGRLDASTITVVEHNLQIIDQAIDQARQALVGDPANTYLSSHLVEARRRKLDLLRRATALTTDMN
jgi:negative regulator of sigma E activity